jgi:type I restriction-modification system DNA methylase subunit
MQESEAMLQRLKQYTCGICGTLPDQISHHKSHLETDKHKTKKELFKLQLEKLSNEELQTKYNTCNLLVILEGVETITTDFILEDTLDTTRQKDNKKLKSKSKTTKTKLEHTQQNNQDYQNNLEDIARMESEAQQANEHLMEISNRDALRDKIHEIHNYLRNNGVGYGMAALKVFNIFYGLKKFEMCNEEYTKKLQPGDPDLYAKYKLDDKCRFSRLMEKIKYMNDYKFNDPRYPEKPEYYDETFIKYILKDVLDGINASMLNQYLMYEIPDDLQPKIYKHIITEIDSIFDIEKQCNVLLSGKIYEYFIGRDETAISELGAYFTDRHIVDYIYNKLKPKPDENGNITNMIDMFGGSGGFTTGYIDYLNKHYSCKINWAKELKKIHHYDMNKDVVKSAWLEMFCLTGELPYHENVKSTNSFMSEFNDKKFKLIVTNPPYGGDKVSETNTQIKHTKIKEHIKKILPTIEDENEKLKLSIQLKEIEKEEKTYKLKLEFTKVGLHIKGHMQERTSRRINTYAEEHNISTANDKESVSLIMLMDMLDIGGTACGVLKEGVFFNKTYKDIRKCLVENYNVREVISVPSDQFENTTTKTSILIFDNLADKKTGTVKFSEMVIQRYEEDKFIIKNGYVYLVENKGDISGIVENEISNATREEILANPICSLNGKDYSKNTMEAGEGFKLVKLGDIVEFLAKSKRKAGEAKETGKYNFYTSSYKVMKCDIADYKQEALIIGTGGNSSIHLANNFSCSADNFIINSKYNKYIYYMIKSIWNEFTSSMRGSTIKHLTKDIMIKFNIPIPTTDQSIKQWVDKISKPFDDMNSKKSRISVLEEEVQTRIKEITENEDCDEVELGGICKLKDGYDFYRNEMDDKQQFLEGNNLPLLKIGCDDISDYVKINKKYENFIVNKNDLVIGTKGTCGKIRKVIVNKGYHKHGLLKLCNYKINKNYLYYILLNLLDSDMIDKMSNKSVLANMKKTNLEKLKISIPKDKSLITALEPKFEEIEKLQDEVKQAEALYKQYLDELATAAIKKSSTPDITSTPVTTSIPITPITTSTPDTTSTEPTTPDTKLKKSKVSITKKKTPKAQQIIDTSLDGILGATSS